MKTTIITSGGQYVDIDAFACIFAYKELLELRGEKVEAVITAKRNASITEKYRKLNFYKKEDTNIRQIKDKQFVLVDISDYHYFEKCVDVDLVAHIFDHHVGFENYWKEKIGERAVIEPIGAAATLIYREYKKSGLADKISPLAAELLAVAILSNTLNFQAKITKKTDHVAYEELRKFFVCMDADSFEVDYFLEVQENVENNIMHALRDDAKLNARRLVAQLEVWDAEYIMKMFRKEIASLLANTDADISFLNMIEIGKKRNIVIFHDQKSLEYLRYYFPEWNYDEKSHQAITLHVFLRKEILTRIYEKDRK